MNRLLAIDPGPAVSAFVVYSPCFVPPGNLHEFGEKPNVEMEAYIRDMDTRVMTLVLEDIKSYGARVGSEVFDTCKALGRFALLYEQKTRGLKAIEIDRREIKSRVCGTALAKDGDVRAALLDLWGGKERALGKKASPGPLFGVKEDVWAALAIAVAMESRLLDELRAKAKVEA